MNSGITRQALRRHRWTLAGPFVTQTVAAATVTTMVATMQAIDATPLPHTERATAQVADILDATEVFIGVSVYLSILVVGVTMAVALAGQLRGIALQRTVGATPGQIRRSAALQAAIVAGPASIVGFVLSIPLGSAWTALLRSRGVMPDQVTFAPSMASLPIALGIVVATSVVGTLIAAARISRLRPGEAMTEVATGRRHVGRCRTTVGASLVIAGVALSVVLSLVAPEQSGDGAFFVMLAQCIGVGLLGPHLLRVVLRAARPFAGQGVVRVALDDVGSMSRALSAALVPLILAAAFALVKIAAHTTTAHVTGRASPAADLWIDLSGTAVYCAFAAVAAVNCLVTVTVSRRRDLGVLRVAGATRLDVMTIVAVQAAIVTAVAAVVAGVVAAVTLAPMLHASLGSWLPYVPFPVTAAAIAAIAAIAGVGMILPAAVLTRQRPSQPALAP